MRYYLKYAENKSKEMGYTMDGVRVYLGAYPTEAEVGYTTMFMVPTRTASFAKAGSMLNLLPTDNGDVPDGSPLNDGVFGNPPPSEYPQQKVNTSRIV